MKNLEELYEVIKDRIKNPKEDSYTSKIAKKEKWIKEKIKEESEEVLNYKDEENLIGEVADLTYFILILLAKKGIPLKKIREELERRRK